LKQVFQLLFGKLFMMMVRAARSENLLVMEKTS